MWWLFACSPARPPPPPPRAESGTDLLVELILDRGHVDAGAWISEAAAGDRLVVPDVPVDTTGAFSRAWATLPVGPGIARVYRAGCDGVDIPYTVDLTRTVVLAYPACRSLDGFAVGSSTLGLAEVTAGEYATMAIVDPTIPAGPADPGGPAVWVDLPHAAAWCAWNGWRLPTLAEFEGAEPMSLTEPVWNGTRTHWGDGPVPLAGRLRGEGPADLRGNVAEWLADGSVAGGSWMSRDFGRRTDVPALARTDTIGFRCATGGP